MAESRKKAERLEGTGELPEGPIEGMDPEFEKAFRESFKRNKKALQDLAKL